MKKFTLLFAAMLFSMMSFAATVTFSPGDFAAVTDAAFEVEAGGVTLSVSKGTITADQFRFFKSQTLTVSSSAGNITSIEITCTANDAAKYGPGSFGALDGYTYSGKVGTWKGSAASVTFSTTNNQVRATQVVVTVDGEGGNTDNPGTDNPGNNDDPVTPEGATEIKGLVYADAYYYEFDGVAYYDIDMYKDVDPDTYEYTYPEVYVSIEAKSKTALNGTYDVWYAGYWKSANDSIEINETTPGTVTIKNTDNEGNYSISGSFVGADGKTYTFNDVVNVWAFDYDNWEEITLSEDGTTDNPGTDEPGNDNPGTDNPGNDTPGASASSVTFDADVDKGNASEDSANQTAYTVSKSGVTLDVTKGIIGKFNDENHYRIYKGETLTITSTVGNIVSVEFTCTANDDAKYGPGCFTVNSGDYTYSGAVGTWIGNAASVEFTAFTNQVRTTQIVVKVATATDVENVTTVIVPVKVMQDGQLMIICGENVYNAFGAQVK